MTDSTTTYYGWSYPTVNADASTWGATLNATIVAIDAQMHTNAQGLAPTASPTFTGTLTANVGNFGGSLAAATAAGDHGVRIMGDSAGGAAILQFTNNAGTTQWATLTASGPSGALTAANGFSGSLTGNVTGNVTGNCSGSSGSCTGNAATASSATTATTATNLSGGSVSCTTLAASGASTLGSAVTIAGAAQTTSVTVTFSATAMALNCALSNVFKTTLTANVTTAPTLSNPADGQTINWFLTQDGTGSRTMTWPTSFKWSGSSTLSTAASSVDLLVATYRSDTGFWYASLLKAFT